MVNRAARSLAIVLALSLPAAIAHAAPSACAAAKLKAAAKRAAARLRCYEVGLRNGAPVSDRCLAGADATFLRAVPSSDACPGTDAAAIEAGADTAADALTLDTASSVRRLRFALQLSDDGCPPDLFTADASPQFRAWYGYVDVGLPPPEFRLVNGPAPVVLLPLYDFSGRSDTAASFGRFGIMRGTSDADGGFSVSAPLAEVNDFLTCTGDLTIDGTREVDSTSSDVVVTLHRQCGTMGGGTIDCTVGWRGIASLPLVD